MSDKALKSAELEVTQKIQTHFPRGLKARVLAYANSCPVERLTEAVRQMLEGLENAGTRVFRIVRGGKRTTEQVISTTTHTYVNDNINSENFPLAEAPEEERELVAFQFLDWNYNPTSEKILSELKRRGLERPTHEDALKFDEAYPDEKGFFVFLHEPWLDPDSYPYVLVVRRDDVNRELDLPWFDVRWGRHSWFVGVRPRK